MGRLPWRDPAILHEGGVSKGSDPHVSPLEIPLAPAERHAVTGERAETITQQCYAAGIAQR